MNPFLGFLLSLWPKPWSILCESYFTGALSSPFLQLLGMLSVLPGVLFQQFSVKNPLTCMASPYSAEKPWSGSSVLASLWASGFYVQWSIYQAALLTSRHSNAFSESAYKITAPSHANMYFPFLLKSLYISTGTFSFLIRKLRKLTSSWNLSPTSSMNTAQKTSLCNEASTCAPFPSSLLKPLVTHPWSHSLFKLPEVLLVISPTLLFKTTTDFHIQRVR